MRRSRPEQAEFDHVPAARPRVRWPWLAGLLALVLSAAGLVPALVHLSPAAASNPADPTCSAPQHFRGGTGAFYSNQFASNYVTAPPTGTADVPNAHFMNVFLFPKASAGDTWDAHLLTLPANQRGPTMEQIDAMTKDLVCSSYFDLLTQYNINPPTFDGDVDTSSTCVQNALNDAISTGNVISYATMRTFAGCEQSVSGANPPQINIFVSPDVMASAYGEDTFGMCGAGSSAAAYHGWGLNVPNFTVVPTTPACAGGGSVAGQVLDSLSHEMVELVSDPGGFGWVHASDVGHLDLAKQLDEGELGDICSFVGAYPTPPTNPGFVSFPSTPDLVTLGLTNLSVAPYWSDQDAACEPTAIMNDTLASVSGTPLIRMTGSTHDLAIPITQTNPPAGLLDSLELDVVTGTDNLNSSSAFNVVVQTKIGGRTFNLQQNAVNQGAEWGTASLHAALLTFPGGIPVSSISKITLNTQLSGDNWDVDAVMVQAAVVPDSSGCNTTGDVLVDRPVPSSPLLPDGSPGLVRMVGGAPQTFTMSVNTLPAAERNRLVTGLFVSIMTTGDDLRGGNSPDANVDALLNLQGGGRVTFSNINRNQNLPNNQTTIKNLSLLQINSLPPQTRLSDIMSFALQTNLPGGSSGDNWDVGAVQLFVELGCPAAAHPTTMTTTLLDLNGSTPLSDGSTGLCRLTGFAHDCPQTIPAPLGFSGTEQVVGLSATITTGNDDLRGSGFADEDASVTVHGFPTFGNVNLFQTWPNNAIRTVALAPLPSSPVPLSQLTSIDVSTHFGGGSGSDNWDVKGIKLDATVIIPTTSSAIIKQPSHASTRAATLGALAALDRASTPTAELMADLDPPVPSPWTVVPSPNPGAADNVLNAVACVTPANCVAVGSTSPNGDAPQALIEMWNGTTWNAVPAPSTGEQYSVLNGVACVDPNDCYAVGFDGSGATEGSLGTEQLLIETWNGTSWNVTRSGNPAGDTTSRLEGVSCVGGQLPFCQAVGYQSGDGVARTLTMRFQDRTWLPTASPNADLGNDVLYGVSCTSSTHCAAVGYSDGSGLAQTLTMDWNGSSWVITPSGNAGTPGNVYDGMGNNFLYSVSCTSPVDCVAVGATIDDHRIAKTLIEGTEVGAQGDSWSPQPSPNPGISGSLLHGVSCTSASNCTAVGVQFDGDIDRTLNLNFDGTNWFSTPTPDPGPTRNFLLGTVCVTPLLCTAVGDDVDDATSVKQTLVMNFTPTAPNEPTGATAIGLNAQAQVSFVAPTDNGGREITGYTVTANDVTNPPAGGQTASGPASPITVSGLANGDTYNFTVTATNPIGTGPASAPSNSIIVNQPGKLSVGDATVLEGDSGSRTLKFAVTLSTPASNPVTVQYSLSGGGSATGAAKPGSGVDFLDNGGAPRTLTFTPNPKTLKTPIVKYVAVKVLGDTTVEPDETLALVLANPTGGPSIGRSTGVGTILNDDGITNGVTLGVGDASMVLQAEGNQTMKIPVTLSAKASGPVTVNFTVTPGSATFSQKSTGGGDYGGKTSGTLSFGNGTNQTISIPIWADPNPDPDETFTVTLSGLNGSGVTVIRSTATGTIFGGFH